MPFRFPRRGDYRRQVGLLSAVLHAPHQSFLTSACQTWIMRGQRTKVLREQTPSLIARFDRYLMRGAYERAFSAHIRFLHAVVGRPRRSRILARMQKGTLDPQPYAGLRCNVESILALALVSAIPADPPTDGTQIRGGAQPLSSGDDVAFLVLFTR